MSELYQGSIAQDSIVNNDPDLAPERSWTTELSAVNDFDHGNLRATLFFEDTRDALYSQVNVAAGSTVTTIQNVGRMRTRGLELSGQWRRMRTARALRQRHLRSFAHRRERQLSGQRRPVAAARARWRATALASWRPRDRLSATFGARYSGQQYSQLDNSDPHGAAYTGTSHYLVYDTRLRMNFGRWTASLGIDNLGNERYWAFHPYSRRTYNAEIAANL